MTSTSTVRGGSKLTLKELRHVWLLHQTLNFKRAAEQAGISQSALSQSIASIEKRLGVQLFHRDRRTVTATLFAALVAERAEYVMHALEEMDFHIDALRDAREGSVTFGMGIFAANHLLNPVLMLFHERHPEIHLRTFVDHVGELQDRLLRGEIQLFVAARDPRFRDAVPNREPLYCEQLVVACRSGHPLVKHSVIGCRELIRYPAVTYDGDYLRRQIYPRLKNSMEFALLERNVPAVVVQQPWLLVDFVQTSDHLIVASKAALQPWLRVGRLVAVDVDDLDMAIDVELVFRRGVPALPAIQRMVETVREVVASQQL